MRSFDRSYGTHKYILPLVLDAPDYKFRASIANMYTYLDDFMNTLVLELSRIDETNLKMEKVANQSVENFDDRLLFVYLWADYYFFLNTVERTYRLVINLYNYLSENDKAQKIRNSKVFNDVRLIRNRIEHLYEDVSKGTGEEFYAQHRSMGAENEITIGDITFAANENALYLLYQIYDDISNIIEEKYINPNKDVVDRIWKAHCDNM